MFSIITNKLKYATFYVFHCLNYKEGMDMHEIKENRENVYRSLTEAMKSPDFNDYYFLAR